MGRTSKHSKNKTAVEALVRQGANRQELTKRFPEIPASTLSDWFYLYSDLLKKEAEEASQSQDEDDSEAIAVNIAAVELPTGKIVNLNDYKDGEFKSLRRHATRPQDGVSNFYAVVHKARKIIDSTDSEYAAIAAGQLMLKCLYAQAELPRHIVEGTTATEASQIDKQLDQMSPEELNRLYQEKLGNL